MVATMTFNPRIIGSIASQLADRFSTEYDFLFVLLMPILFIVAVVIATLIEIGKKSVVFYRRGSLEFGWFARSMRLGLTAGMIAVLSAIVFYSFGYSAAVRNELEREAKIKVAFLEAVATRNALPNLPVHYSSSSFVVFYYGTVSSADEIYRLKQDLALLLSEEEINLAIRELKVAEQLVPNP